MAFQLTLSLLGGFNAQKNGEPLVRFGYDKVRALYAYLAVEAEHVHRRDTLASLLWPDQDDRSARHSLSQALLKLRKALGAQKEVQPIFLADRHTIRFHPEIDLWLDSAIFEGETKGILSSRGPSPSASPPSLAPEDAERLARAVALYRGDLLEGLILPDAPAFDEWVAVRREYFHRLALEALAALAAFHDGRGEWPEAETFLRRLVTIEPWDEDAHARLMRTLARTGDYSAALAQYQTCRQLLSAELGVAPMPETTLLYERIQAARWRSPQSTFPVAPTPLVGRQREIEEVRRILLRPGVRLLTVVGPGGVGKTRLALAAAAGLHHNFLEGVFYVSLAETAEAGELLPLLASALDLPLKGAASPSDQIRAYLADREMLLVLDNMEQLLPAGASLLQVLLGAAPDLKLLLTSRVALNLRAEHRFPLGGLPSPPETATVGAGDDYSALTLFRQAAQRVDPRFAPSPAGEEAIAAICRLVGGLPLALELSAAWTRAMSCAAILTQIRENIDFLAATFHDLPARHRSLRAVLQQSWALLNPAAQRALARLAIFRDTFTLDAARAVAATTPATLATLADHSWLSLQGGQGTVARYALHELLRHFAADKLAAMPEEEAAARKCHTDYYLELAASQVTHLYGPQSEASIRMLRPERANIRAAWQWAVDRQHLDPLGAAVEGIGYLFMKAGWQAERFTLFQEALQALAPRLESGPSPPPVLTRTLSHLHLFQATDLLARGDRDAAEQAAETAAALAARHGHLCREAEARTFLGWIWQLQARYRRAEKALTRALEMLAPAGETRLLALAHVRLGTLYYRMGRAEAALAAYERARALYETIGYQAGMASSLSGIGLIHYVQGDCDGSLAAHRQALALDEALGNRGGVARHVGNIGFLHRERGDYQAALAAYERALALDRALGFKPGIALWLANIGAVHVETQRWPEAMTAHRQALTLLRRVGNRNELAETLLRQARVLLALGDLAAAAALREEGIALAGEIGREDVVFTGELLAARLEAARGERETARQQLLNLLAESDDPARKEAIQTHLCELEE